MPENLDLVRSIYADWERGDLSRADGADPLATALDYIVVDDSRVLALVRNTGRGKTSGVELEQRSVGNLFEIREGRVTRLVVYLDFALARADLALED